MKKIIITLLMLLFALSITACKNDVKDDIIDDKDDVEEEVTIDSVVDLVEGSVDDFNDDIKDYVVDLNGDKYTENSKLETSLLNGITHINSKGNVLKSDGVNKILNVNALIKSSDDNVIVTNWSKLNSNSVAYSNVLDLAKDFELNNPGYKVIGGVNGDYFTAGNTVNASVRFGGDITKLQNHDKYSNIALTYDGKLLGQNKKLEYSLYQLTISKDNKVLYTGSIDRFNNEEANTTVYNNYTPKVDEDVYIVSEVTNKLSLEGMYFYKGNIDTKGTKTNLTSNQLGIKTNDKVLLEILKTNPTVRIQPMLKDNSYLNASIIGVGSKTLDNGNILDNGQIVDQYVGFSEEIHPRTSIGFTNDGGVVLATFDGRQTNSYGIDLNEESYFMKKLGCTYAFNLDGGGSTQMVGLNDEDELVYLNNPSDPSPYRSVQNAVLLVKPINESKINSSFTNLSGNSVTLNYNIKLPDEATVNEVTIEAYNKVVNTTKLKGTINLTNLINNEANTIIVKVRYNLNGKEYSEEILNKMVNLDYKVTGRQPIDPSNFKLNFSKTSKGFEVKIDYDDPDNIVKLLFIKKLSNNQIFTYDPNKPFTIKASSGDSFEFSISYSYHNNDNKLVIKELEEVYKFTYKK